MILAAAPLSSGSPAVHGGQSSGYTVIRFSTSSFLLHFDDLEESVNVSLPFLFFFWTPAEVSEFDYLKGFFPSLLENIAALRWQ